MKEQVITIPNNFEIKEIKDGKIVLVEKKNKLTYEDVVKELYPHSHQKLMSGYFSSEKHLQKLIAINKLMNVAKYLNDGWQPDWNNESEAKYFIFISKDKDIKIDFVVIYCYSSICFKSEELAKQAIDILGEDTIKLALCTDY